MTTTETNTVTETNTKPVKPVAPTHDYAGRKLSSKGDMMGTGDSTTNKVLGNAKGNLITSDNLLPGQFFVYGDPEDRTARKTDGLIMDLVVRKRSNKEKPGAWASKLKIFRVRPTDKKEFAETGAQWRVTQTKTVAKAATPEAPASTETPSSGTDATVTPTAGATDAPTV